MNTIKYGITYTDRNMKTHHREFSTEQETFDYIEILDSRILKGTCHGYQMTKIEAQVETGDKISALGYTFTVGKILYQDYFYPDGFDVEFLDNRGGYHHWKQWEDGGKLIKNRRK